MIIDPERLARLRSMGWREDAPAAVALAAATEGRLARLMRDFRWGRMDEVFPEIARAT